MIHYRSNRLHSLNPRCQYGTARVSIDRQAHILFAHANRQHSLIPSRPCAATMTKLTTDSHPKRFVRTAFRFSAISNASFLARSLFSNGVSFFLEEKRPSDLRAAVLLLRHAAS
jgi:hypothetical protein